VFANNKYILKYTTGLLYLAFIALIFNACSIGTNPNIKTPSEQEIQLASSVVSQTLASNSDGLMSSIYDLTGTVTPNGFIYDDEANTQLSEDSTNIVTDNPDSNNGDNNRGNDSNFQISYNPETGVHLIEFQRDLNNKNLNKSLHLKLEYVYRDTLGIFIRFPLPSITESIDYKGLREGELQTKNKHSQFTRVDTLYFSGLQDKSNNLIINGSHYAKGEIQQTQGNGSEIDKKFRIHLNLINVTVNKDSLYHNSNLESAINGILNYDLTFHQVNDTSKVDSHLKGSINLTGNGYALLKFVNFSKRFLINLKSGDISENN
jgi:hypothetical protein